MCLKHSFDKKEEEEKEKAAGRNQSLLTACTGAYERMCAHVHMCVHAHIFIYKFEVGYVINDGYDGGVGLWNDVIDLRYHILSIIAML